MVVGGSSPAGEERSTNSSLPTTGFRDILKKKKEKSKLAAFLKTFFLNNTIRPKYYNIYSDGCSVHKFTK